MRAQGQGRKESHGSSSKYATTVDHSHDHEEQTRSSITNEEPGQFDDRPEHVAQAEKGIYIQQEATYQRAHGQGAHQIQCTSIDPANEPRAWYTMPEQLQVGELQAGTMETTPLDLGALLLSRDLRKGEEVSE
eukprot:CAMPEP_0177672096 /NCGR_PEP_ID=MMETSP0447-20121125/25120_1 /TAXON_ID=0 /ORGANISM="Stygamoeba regulata, Strain BSH-02190019" /LENGTH=132 /DNA_ID=CAMNT_0019179663 /DNA_START=1119 /DNA_END=1519 /DNA_ORIENTATION=+